MCLNTQVWLRIERPIDVEADIPLKEEASEKIKRLYCDEHWGDLIIWASSNERTVGCMRYNRSISMPLDKVRILDFQEMKRGKGQGYVQLSFLSANGDQLGGIYSCINSKKSYDWLSKIQPVIAKALSLEQRVSNHGHDT